MQLTRQQIVDVLEMISKDVQRLSGEFQPTVANVGFVNIQNYVMFSQARESLAFITERVKSGELLKEVTQ